jgi:hypothetical protein
MGGTSVIVKNSIANGKFSPKIHLFQFEAIMGVIHIKKYGSLA